MELHLPLQHSRGIRGRDRFPKHSHLLVQRFDIDDWPTTRAHGHAPGQLVSLTSGEQLVRSFGLLRELLLQGEILIHVRVVLQRVQLLPDLQRPLQRAHDAASLGRAQLEQAPTHSKFALTQ